MIVHPNDEETSEKKRKRPEFPQGIEIFDLESDSFCFTPIKEQGNSKNNAISVELYTEERDLRLAIKLSTIDLANSNDDIFLLDSEPLNTPFSKKREKVKKPFSYPSVSERGESSNSKPHRGPSFICEICVEPRHANEKFNSKGCSHAYCTDCMIKYVDSKLENNITALSCPCMNCDGLLEPEYCRHILPKEVFDRWGYALCEAMVLGSQTFYCPFKDCSMLLIDDGEEAVKESECPGCRRLFCAQCRVPWHAEISCREFQQLHKDEREREDIMMMKLAKKNKSVRCPRCRFFVGKTSGYSSMRCRCGMTFCYACGSASCRCYLGTGHV